MEPIPVLYVLDSHTVGGAELTWVELIEHLDRREVAPTFVCPPAGVYDPIAERAVAAGARCLARAGIEGSFDKPGKRRFAALLDGWPGLVHFNQNTPDACRHHVPVARGRGLPLLSTLHALGKPVGPWTLKGWRRRRTFGAMDRIVCVSRAVAATVPPRSRGALVVQPPFLPDVRFTRARELEGRRAEARARLGVPDAARVAVRVGAAAAGKNATELIDALPGVIERVPGFVLLVVGADRDGAVDRLKDHAARRGVDAALRFVGWTDDVLAVLAAGDVLVHAATTEGFGRVVQEAMLMGLPAVAFRVGGLPEVVDDERTGLLVEPGDFGALAARLAELLTDPARCAAMGEAAREVARRSYAASSAVGAYVGLYRELDGARRST